jgi:hypothetical protein
MLRGPVVDADGQAWSNGTLRSSDYFARVRERALAKASDAVRERLRRDARANGHSRA